MKPVLGVGINHCILGLSGLIVKPEWFEGIVFDGILGIFYCVAKDNVKGGQVKTCFWLLPVLQTNNHMNVFSVEDHLEYCFIELTPE